MKCKQVKSYFLLYQSGELSSAEKRLLDEHLAVCPECSAYIAGSEQMMRAIKHDLPSGEPSQSVIKTIKDAAGKAARSKGGKSAVSGFEAFRPWLAAAAVILVAAAVWVLLGLKNTSTFDSMIAQVEPQTIPEERVVNSDVLLDLRMIVWDNGVDRIIDLGSASDVSLVDRDLMILEGLAI